MGYPRTCHPTWATPGPATPRGLPQDLPPHVGHPRTCYAWAAPQAHQTSPTHGKRRHHKAMETGSSKQQQDPKLQNTDKAPCDTPCLLPLVIREPSKAPCDTPCLLPLDPLYHMTGTQCPATHLAHPRPIKAAQHKQLQPLLLCEARGVTRRWRPAPPYRYPCSQTPGKRDRSRFLTVPMDRI